MTEQQNMIVENIRKYQPIKKLDLAKSVGVTTMRLEVLLAGVEHPIWEDDNGVFGVLI